MHFLTDFDLWGIKIITKAAWYHVPNILAGKWNEHSPADSEDERQFKEKKKENRYFYILVSFI